MRNTTASIASELRSNPKRWVRMRGPTAGRNLAARREKYTAWLFLTPFLVLFFLFTALPAIIAISASLTDMSTKDIREPLGVNFTGVESYAATLQTSEFRGAFVNTLIFVVLCVPISTGMGLALALVLNSGIKRLRTVFRAAVYVPVITNIVAAAMIWQYAFSVTGPVNSSLQSLGVPPQNWLGSPLLAVGTVALMGIWRTAGICMVLFLAGLQSIPTDLYEAAETDGAGPGRRLWSITLPLLRPTTLLVTVLMTVAFLNIFEEPYLLTKGGPVGSTRSLALWVYEQFGFGNTAASMAGSVMLLILVALVATIQFRLLRPKH